MGNKVKKAQTIRSTVWEIFEQERKVMKHQCLDTKPRLSDSDFKKITDLPAGRRLLLLYNRHEVYRDSLKLHRRRYSDSYPLKRWKAVAIRHGYGHTYSLYTVMNSVLREIGSFADFKVSLPGLTKKKYPIWYLGNFSFYSKMKITSAKQLNSVKNKIVQKLRKRNINIGSNEFNLKYGGPVTKYEDGKQPKFVGYAYDIEFKLEPCKEKDKEPGVS